MSNSKILLRSQILDIIYKLKSSRNFSDKNMAFVISELEKIEDVSFLFATLLKEINCQDAEFDCVLSLILKKIDSELLQKNIWELLNSKTVSDRKKLFLINILRDLGAKVDYSQIQEYVSNPDEIVDLETKNFLQVAKINPEAQIDFLDFFFTVSDSDKSLLLNSIIEDFASDELANVVAPIIYFNPAASIVPTCILALKESKSYLAFEPLNWILENVEDAGLKQLAKKTINELKLMGLRETYSREELFKATLKHSVPVGYWASTVDGADNYSLIFARQKNNDEISTFFTVINLKHGASASFGFDSITYEEFEKILKRFFVNSYMIPLEIPVGQRLLEDAISAAKNTPYELLCWRTLTYDIKPMCDDIEQYFSKNLEKIDLTEFDFKKIIQENFVDNWFFKNGENIHFDKLVDDICKDSPDISSIEKLIGESIENIFSDEKFNTKLLLQAYFLSQIDHKKAANILFSLIDSPKFKEKLYEHIIKKSIYQYFLEMLHLEPKGKVHAFGKREKTPSVKNVNAEAFIKLIEDAWTK